MKTYLTFLLVLFGLALFGQQKEEIDSLKALLNLNHTDEYQAQLNLNLSKLIENSVRDSSETYAKTAAQIASKINDRLLLSNALLQLGIIYYKQRKDDRALNYFDRIDSLYALDKTVLESYFMSKVYRSEISKFTFTKEGVMQAKSYILQALALANDAGNEKLINRAKYRLAEWHGFMSQEEFTEEHLDSARAYIKSVLPYYNRMQDFTFLAKSYHTLASIESVTENFPSAAYYYQKRLQTLKKTKDSISIGEAYQSFGALYRKMNQLDKGLSYLDSAMAVLKKTGFSTDKRKKDLYKDYAYLYEAKKDYKNAFNYMYQALLLKDTIYENENTKLAMELEKKYQAQLKDQEIVLLKTQNDLVAHQKKNQQNLFLSSVGLIILGGTLFMILYRNRQKTNKKLLALDKAKSNFFANISHEFRTPLTLISGPIQKQLKQENLTSEVQHTFEMIQRNSDRLLSLVNQLLDISKIEAGYLKLGVREGNLPSFIGQIADSFTFLAIQKEIDYKINIEPVEHLSWFDKNILEKIVMNLLSNALKYTPAKGTVICNSFVKNDVLHLQVKNTGLGLSSEEIENIFKRFYQVNHNNPGVGIGLALVKDLVALHKGTITVKSTPNEWTDFSVTLAVGKKFFRDTEFADTAIAIQPQTHPTGTTTDFNQDLPEHTNGCQEGDQPILLVVDDNEDVRNYVSSLFEDSYQILLAKEGKEGIELAIMHIPDIIISDVMMPLVDGIALCNTLKVDERTCHIPIILLTAKAGEENEIEGIKTGADAYVAKPFNEDLLQLKVEKLIESRKILQNRYSQEVILRPKDVAINAADELFLERVQAVLDTKLIESSFHIDEFCEAVGMSRMQLHRKLKALIGLSASEFIRSQRLKLATQLLKSSDVNISQIGYSVGFNDHAYFSKCFKNMYDCSPSEYASKHKET